ncbi:hypothetical protein ACFE04_018938 [Oxalis oulophora]
MQEAIPYKPSSWPTPPPQARQEPCMMTTTNIVKGSTNVHKLVSENAVIVFTRKGCCMGHVVKRLLLCLGVNPPIYEVEEEEEVRVIDEIGKKMDDGDQFPVVFIGGELFGGLDKVMATHISGELVPLLKQAGALWL